MSKLQEKSRECNWKELTQKQKGEFDEAQANEIDNVIKTAALLSLMSSELNNISNDRVMRMRWVLTTKYDEILRDGRSETGDTGLRVANCVDDAELLTDALSGWASTFYCRRSRKTSGCWSPPPMLPVLSSRPCPTWRRMTCANASLPAELGAAFGSDGRPC